MDCDLEIGFKIGLLETVPWSLGRWCLSAPGLGDLIVLSRGKLSSSVTGDQVNFPRDLRRRASQFSLGAMGSAGGMDPSLEGGVRGEDDIDWIVLRR